MIVSVTQEHINHGKPGECESCPIALVLTDALGAKYVEVGHLFITVDDKDYKVPRSCHRFMDRFDENLKVKPFNFRLEEIK